MAKKDLGSLGWDDSLDYEFDDPFAPLAQQKKRGVITRVATSFAQGAKDAFTSPATVRTIASNMLPKGYGAAISVAEQVHRQGEELHNIALKELEPSLPAMRRITQRNLPKAKKYLPPEIARKLEEFSKAPAFSRGMSPQEMEQAELQRTMAEVFGVQMESDARQNAETKIERALQHAQAMKMDRQQIHTLNLMQAGISRLVAYQDEISNRYQRRSLELKTRHYLLARDAFRLQQETARRVDGYLDALVKNTAMPDIQKQDLAHTAKQTFRNKLLGQAQDSVQSFASGFLGKVGDRAKAGLRDLMGGASGLIDLADNDMGEDVPMLEIMMRMAGQMAVEHGSSALGGKSQAMLGKLFPGMARKGLTLNRLARDWPVLLNRYAQSGTKREGLPGLAEDFFKSLIPTHKLDTTIGRGGLAGMDKPAAWDRLSQRSLVEIIPGLLSRIEHNTARVLDPNAKRQIYSHDRRRFTSVSEAGMDMISGSGQKARRASAKQNVNRFVEEIVGDRPITDATRRAFIRQVQLDSAAGMPFDPDKYISPGSNTPELDAKAKAELANILKGSGQRNGRWDEQWQDDRSESYSRIDFASVLPKGLLQVYRQAGMNDLLHDQGMITTKDGVDHLNMSRLMDLIEQADLGDVKVKEQTAGDRLREAALGAVKSKFKKASGDLSDLYAEGGTERVLEAAKLKMGAYRDATTGMIIEKWEQIKGPVRDVTNNKIVADARQLAEGLYDEKGKKIAFNLRQAATAAANWTTASVLNVRSATSSKIDEVKDVLNSRGEVVLAGWKIKAGHYRDALTKRTIQKIEDIAGPVVDENGRTVVTAADVVNVLKDSAGQKLDNAVSRMRAQSESMAAGLSSPMDSLLGKGEADQPGMFGQEQRVMADGELIRLNTEQVELLKVIAQLLAAQGPGGGGQYPKGFLDSIALFGLKGAWKGAKTTAQGAWWWTKNSISMFTKPLGLAGRSAGAVLSGTAHRVGNIVRGIKDIYVQGKSKPVMIAQKLKLGHYQDVNTKKKVLRWQDVTGAVIDLTTGETVLDQEDFERGLYVKGMAGLNRLANKSLMGFGSSVVSFYGAAASLPFRAASLAVKAIGSTFRWATNKQVDVYVKGESSPRLQASKMKTGRYYNAGPKKTGKVVSTYEDIYGEIKELGLGANVASATDKTVLYENEIHDPGICGRWGMELRTPLSRAIGALGGAAIGVVKGAASLFGGAMKGYGKLFGGLMGLGGGILNAPFKFLGALLNPFEKHGAKQVQLLEKIFNVLDARLPGKKHRKGSWQEQFEMRDAEAKEEKEEAEKQAYDKKFGIGGLFNFFKNKAAGLFGGGDEEEGDEDGDGGDTTILAGGGGGGKDDKDAKRKRRMDAKKRAARRGGRLGFLFRAKDAVAGAGGKVKGKLPRFGKAGGLMGGPAKILAGLAAMAGGSWALDKALGEDSTARKAVSTGADVAGTAATASWLSGMAGGPTIGSVLGGGAAATGAAAGTTAAAGTAAAAAGGITAGGAAAAAGTTAAAAGGTAAAVVGAPVWVPAAIIGAAVAAAGAASYFGYRKYKYGKLVPLRRFRYLQYGVPSGDSDKNKKIFELEEMMLDHVGEVNGGLEIVPKSNSGGKDISMDDVLKLMDLEDGWFSKKSHARETFKVWYARRFKPIFLEWVRAVRSADPTMPLLDADEKLPGPKQAVVVKKAWSISPSVYAIAAGPFEGEPAVTDQSLIEDAYNLAMKEAGKSEGEKTLDKWKDRAKMVGALSPLAGWAMTALDNKLEESKAKKEGAQLTMQAQEKNAGMNFLATAGAIKATGGIDDILNSPLARAGKISALTAIRYRAYGLSDLDVDRVRALAALEALTFKHVSVASTGNAYPGLGIEEVWMKVAGLFGLVPTSVPDRLRWMGWYGNRFVPVCMAYIKAVRGISPQADLQSPERTLKADQLMNVGQAMLNAKTPEGGSIWNWPYSPWSPNEKLNTDSNAISGSMLALKQAGDKKVMAEEALAGQNAAVKNNKSMLQSMMDDMRKGTQQASDWLLGDKNNRNWLGRQVDAAGKMFDTLGRNATEFYGQVKSGDYAGAAGTVVRASTVPGQAVLGQLGFGPGLDHPGKGTGGDINSLPNVPSNAEIAAMRPAQRFAVLKPLFDAVAKMTGVDPNMLYAIASIESTFNPNAKAPTSSASGLFQFINGTWRDMLRDHGKTFGVSPNASPFDARANALMGAMFLKQNFNFMKKRLPRGINETDMYMAHFMGAGGAADFLSRDPNLIGAQVFPKQAAANEWIFYRTVKRGNRMVPDKNQPLKLGEIYQLMQSKVNKAQSVYGGRVQGNAGAPTASATAAASKADFSNVTARVVSGGAPPTTTTTTANGPSGGVGPAQAAQIPASSTNAPNMMQAPGGYAGMMAGMGGMTETMPSAPSLTSTASLQTAAAVTAQDEMLRAQAQERERQAREQQRRAAETQSQLQSRTDQAQMAAIGVILQDSLETQRATEKNTADAVTLLREILRSGMGNKATAETPAEPTPSPEVPANRRPYQTRPDRVPVSTRFATPNG